MVNTVKINDVAEAYGARAAAYIQGVGQIENTAAEDRSHVLSWARGLDGPVLDVGCGPGQWTNFLVEHGVTAAGIDPVPKFIEEAKRRYPAGNYRVGSAEELQVADASLGGVLAWFSLIHTDPDRMDSLLTELARAIKPGSSVLIGFFLGPARKPFDHVVTRAYFWTFDALAEDLERAGFAVTDQTTRVDNGVQSRGILTARRQ